MRWAGLIQIIAFLYLLGFGVSCGGNGSSFSTSSASDAPAQEPVGGNVSALTIDGDIAVVSFVDLDDNEDVLVFLFSFSKSSQSASFRISDVSSAGVSLPYLSEDIHTSDGDITDLFHGMLREYEEGLNPDAALAEGVTSSRSVKKFASVGDERTFKVLNSFSSSSSYDTVTATLRLQGSFFDFYVESDQGDALSEDDLTELADKFEGVIPLGRELFGTESDVNGDGRFAVLFTKSVNELGASGGGFVTGFFYAVDLFDSNTYAVSNEMEVYYTFLPDPDGAYGTPITKNFAMGNIYPGVLSHEYQHLINYNMHANENGGSAEAGWLNEGLAHLAEDIYSADDSGYMTAAGPENPSRVSGYLADIANLCFTCGTSLYQRGGSYLFMRYLYEQAERGNISAAQDGAGLLNKLLDTKLRGVDNVIAAAFGSSGGDDDFRSLFGLFGLTVYLSNTGLTDDNRLGFEGINLRSAQDDNRGTVLNGPAIQEISSFPFLDTLTGNAAIFIQVPGSLINSTGGSLEFSFGAATEFGGYVIRE